MIRRRARYFAQRQHCRDQWFANAVHRESAIVNAVRSDMSEIDGVDIHQGAVGAGKVGGVSQATLRADL